MTKFRELQLSTVMCASALRLEDLRSLVLEIAQSRQGKPKWQDACAKVVAWLGDTFLPTPSPVISPDNDKLNYANFGAAAIGTCPGMGKCVELCYSLRAFRFPHAFFRQIINTVCIRSKDGPLQHVTDAFISLPNSSTFRLYTDGDFDSVETVVYWMDLLRQRPDITCWGYSKSWLELLAANEVMQGDWPDNYMLNRSNGSCHEHSVAKAIEGLPCYRDDFIYVKTQDYGKERYKNPAYKREVMRIGRDLAPDKAFVCPGKCHECTSLGPACAIPEFKGITIFNGEH